MKAPNRRIPRWLKLGMLFLLAALLGLAVYVVKVYYELRSTTVEQVVQRQQQGERVTADADEQIKIPSILEDPLDKATQLSNKPISKQDMMDAAAILLNSGLSMKEMYYLMGQSTEKLTNEEKQHIRDLLLKKLTQEEISALRNITKKYGKGLNILDPNFPIELVGVYDETERKRIQQQLKERGETISNNQPGQITPKAPLNEQTNAPPATGNEKTLKEMEAKYIPRLERLKQSCQSQVQTIINDITGTMADRKTLDEKMMRELKMKYLKRAADAEAGCSRQLQSIIDQAKVEYRQAGLDETLPEGWKQDYEAVKREAQAKALRQLEK